MWSDSESSDDEIIIIRRRRVFLPRNNYEILQGAFEFNERFRLSSVKLEELISAIGPGLERLTERNQALSSKLMILVTLHWMGTGAQYHAVADMHGISKSSVCRAVNSIVQEMFPDLVKWPENMDRVVERFYRLAGMPMVAGCLDGTLVPIYTIDAPTENEEQFVNRHGDHSINCLVVCGPDLQFYYAYANWPGAVHDSRVLKNSGLFRKMEEGWRPLMNSVLLADSGYPLKDWLIPPLVTDPNDQANKSFLRAHKKTRRLIECAIGILKEKFPCLNHLRLNPRFACLVFNRQF